MELAKNKMGNIFKCPHGIIHIRLKGITLHFTEEAFEEFSLMVKQASSKLMEMSLKDLIKEDFYKDE
ncbi:MAG: hypothetical protein DRP68_06140 [Candidatus Omnitrophota bacterium]|nr:MAG: hypothetical protein DRP68_06140 [Candidatus Omnitrophota bacterium]